MPTELADGLGVERSPPTIKADSPLPEEADLKTGLCHKAASETFGPADTCPLKSLIKLREALAPRWVLRALGMPPKA